MENKINSRYYHIALTAYCLLIFILSSLAGDEFPEVDIRFSDKYVHVIVYAILFILFFYSLKNQSKYIKLKKFALEYSVLFTALYGMTDEIHQYFVPKRSCETYDWIADVTGALLIYIIIKIYNHKRKAVLALVSLLILQGCSATGNVQNSNYKITITEQEAWLNLMPVIDDRQNNFGFVIDVKIKDAPDDKNFSVKDLTIYLNNDTLINRNFETEISKEGTDLKIRIFQLNNVRYLDKNKPLPEEAQFTFKINESNKLIKKIRTSKLKINKVY